MGVMIGLSSVRTWTAPSRGPARRRPCRYQSRAYSLTGYETLVARLESLPFLEPPDLDLVGYVTDHALDGLFTVLAQEEQKIREDPLARTTALLQRVFAAQ